MIYAHDTLPYFHTDLGTLQSYHPFDHRKFPALEREIFKREFKPGRLLDNALIVGKGFEACFAVVTAHAAVSHAAKGKLGTGILKTWLQITFYKKHRCSQQDSLPVLPASFHH